MIYLWELFKMALLNCPECNKEISDKSEQCIGCGIPNKFLKKNESKL